MAQQTAVEWLEEIYKNCNKYEESISVSDWEQAKAMEKEQIIVVKNKYYEKDKSWLILPLIAYTKNANGEKEIMFGWLTEVFYIRF
jgi:hypothetical protein